MQDTISNQDIENLDLSKIAALQQKRTLAFVNHFVTTTVQFLNSFSRTCEKKLMQFQEKLEKVDAALILLEAQLSSIPEIKDTSITTDKDNSLTTESTQVKSDDQVQAAPHMSSENTVKPQEAVDTKCDDTVQTKPEYERFVKMVQVGVPLQAVKLKVSLEGLDPGELDSLLKK